MNTDWVEGRVPKIDLPRLRKLCDGTLKEEEEKRYCFRYPAKCKGIGEIWCRLAQKYDNAIFKLNSEVIKVDPKRKQLTLKNLLTNTSTTVSYQRMLSTIPVTQLNLLSENIIPNLRLRHSKVVLVGVALKLPQNELAAKLSWAYYPRPQTSFYRCTIISNFSATMTPDPTKFWSILCEIGRRPEEELDEKMMTKQVVEDLIEVGLVDEENQVHSTWFQVIPYGYPIPTINRKAEMDKCHRILEEHQIYSRGRFGSWHYETSNQDNSFEIGRCLVNRLFLDEPEPPF
ncbi:unnamed protein product [Bursaphelenchus xylophilus]|uniref:(pine wood nematode) hypothetical protein n=1 Tax=Bursaphelenchus xylophilus TaxID=6326 RepID=A0A1I7SA03_BURXY|nr:unnamed protein product [Bursaphelenchus xylophilus]CAG9126092.1 unnamed protein product [Bursaphelenchus xylophilus]